ncbi:MAG: hypothetical protein APZ16_06075 [Candidatus Hadarchaeum yellowstonense]|uniref:UPF0216 protein APZ16_06075 n=1 Tax=Hadarchaeum yellowstonense TaxID=1776334 RepID=A0A147JV28_HADYE|nr:MAG: hypothetical protein APZ16_06075 [Candidatus Hadarchaeum yellowstonense]
MEQVIKFELGRLNAHLPVKRISLKSALSASRPAVQGKNGNLHYFKREELKLLSKLLPESEWDKLQLPILIALESKLGRGAARISGEIEAKVIGKILQREATDNEIIVYRPELALIRRKLPTTTQYMFVW